jgi:putative N6-adenine-specific DNA methylase
MRFSASCAFGLEAVLGRELRNLELEGVTSDNGRVYFEGGWPEMARANLWCRTADRIWLHLGDFPASTFEELFEGTKALDWSSHLPKNASFPVEGLSHYSQLTSVPACQSIVKKAVVENLKTRYGGDWLDEDGPNYPIRFILNRDRCALEIDTSGTGLHKRGYRMLTNLTPLRETLAAGLVQLSYWSAGRLLVDPFCGSGTILIEAAMLALNRAPGLRRDFVSESWPHLGGRIWEEARAEAEERFDRHTKLEILGYDIDPEVLRHARANLRKAGLDDRGVYLETRSVDKLRSQRKYGVLISNPPYGDRDGDREQAEWVYGQLGQMCQPLLDTWSIYVLTSHPRFAQFFGKREDKRRKLYNGFLECVYYQYLGPRPPQEV